MAKQAHCFVGDTLKRWCRNFLSFFEHNLPDFAEKRVRLFV